MMKINTNKIIVSTLMLVCFNANASNAENICKQAVYLGGGSDGFAWGFCNGTSYPARYWQCVVNAINESGKRGYTNEDAGKVIAYAVGYGGC